MKNIIIILLLIIIAVLIFFYYKQSKQISAVENSFSLFGFTGQDVNIDSINLIFKKIKSQYDLFTPEGTNTFPITDSAAKLMVKECVSSMFDIDSPPYNHLDSIERSVYFKLGLIVQSLDSMKSLDSIYPEPNNFGLRVYFAKYLNETRYNDRYTTVIKLTYDSLNLVGHNTTFNLGGLCPPDCPKSPDSRQHDYFKKDPLFH